MCIICVSQSGVRLPNHIELRNMFERNPHGAGFMYARNGRVHIHKGFMTLGEFENALRYSRLTAKDTVIYHFRISTQAGISPEMTHPFPLSNQRAHMNLLDVSCKCGVAHNGIIRLTSNPNERRYSDTAIFITDYLASILHSVDDLHDQQKLDLIFDLAESKFAILDRSGYVATIGNFIEKDGLLFSNDSYKPRKYAW